jgi:hypothetical protein
MPANVRKATVPRYHGTRWIRNGLPKSTEAWLHDGKPSIPKHQSPYQQVRRAVREAVKHQPWQPPKQPIYFIADPHADAEAFNASLVASGGIRKTGPALSDIALTKSGREALFIIGGDCLDKGPSNLQLLHAIRQLMDTGAKVKLLGGNHDVRLLVGIRAMMLKRHTLTEHLFVRMGPKVIPLLKEVHDIYLDHDKALRGIPSDKRCRHKLFPSDRWFEEFPEAATSLLSKPAIDRELSRMRHKVDGFEYACQAAGLSMRQVYATAQKCRDLFFAHHGEFRWFVKHMQLTHRAGSFLFVHAGLDDRIAKKLEKHSIKHLNKLFHRQLQRNPFKFYYGPVANTMRTKYRRVDLPLTSQGVERVYRQGIHAIVHGHRNRKHGQRIMLRQGLLHFECDTTLDRNTRAKEGLRGYGAGVTIIDPQGRVIGVSTDYPNAKVFDPTALLKPHRKRSHATR